MSLLSTLVVSDSEDDCTQCTDTASRPSLGDLGPAPTAPSIGALAQSLSVASNSDDELFADAGLESGEKPQSALGSEGLHSDPAGLPYAPKAPKPKRGRPKGMTEAAKRKQRLEDVGSQQRAKMSRKESASCAAQKKQEQIRHENLEGGQVDSAEGKANKLSAAEFVSQALMLWRPPLPGDKKGVSGDTDLHAQLVTAVAEPVEDTSFELQLIKAGNTHQSLQSLQKELGISRRTIVRRRRLIAATILVYKKVMSANMFARTHAELERKHGDRAVPLNFCVKYRFDEMSLRLRMRECGETDKPTVLAKLLQVSVVHAALWSIPSP